MKILFQEYGRTVLTIVTGVISIGICMFFLTKYFTLHVKEEQPILDTIHVGEQGPIIVAPRSIKVDKGDTNFATEQTYMELVETYMDATKSIPCEDVQVLGVGDVDINCPGRYRVIYKATNQHGHTFLKAVPVFVR